MPLDTRQNLNRFSQWNTSPTDFSQEKNIAGAFTLAAFRNLLASK